MDTNGTGAPRRRGTARTAARCRSCMIVTDTDIFAFIWTYLRSFALNLACFDARRSIAAMRGTARHKRKRDDGRLYATSLVAANGCAVFQYFLNAQPNPDDRGLPPARVPQRAV